MAHFYGTLNANGKEVTKRGNKNSGLSAIAASYQGAVRVDLDVDSEGRDTFTISLIPWKGSGINREIASGLLSGESVAYGSEFLKPNKEN